MIILLFLFIKMTFETNSSTFTYFITQKTSKSLKKKVLFKITVIQHIKIKILSLYIIQVVYYLISIRYTVLIFYQI